jgi:hypothetical protein
MNHLVMIKSPTLPALVTAASKRASTRFLEFLDANICNTHTRRAYREIPGLVRERRHAVERHRPP